MLSELRKPRKRWTEILAEAEATGEIHDDKKSNILTAARKVRSATSLNSSKFQKVIAARFIAKRLGPLVRDKIRSGKLTCRKSIENLQEPPVLAVWEKHWDKSTFCCMCYKPAVNDVIPCELCNNVIHRLCLHSSNRETTPYRMDNQKASKLAEQLYLRRDLFYCDICQDTMKAEIDHHDRIYQKLLTARVYRVYGVIIAYRVLTFIRRNYFRRLRKALVLLQSLVRRLVTVRRVIALRRQLLRNVIVEVRGLPPITRNGGKGLVVLAVIDPVTRAQIFRMEKALEKAETEAFLIPGINANATIAVTLCYARPDDVTNSFVMLVQAQLARRTDKDFMRQRSYTMIFSENIKWLPQDVKTQHCEQLYIQHVSTYIDIIKLITDAGDLGSISSLGRDSVEDASGRGGRLLRRQNSLDVLSIQGSISASARASSASHLHTYDNSSILTGTGTLAAASVSGRSGTRQSIARGSSSPKLLDSNRPPSPTESIMPIEHILSCELYYAPLKPFMHFCQSITAPQLGYLKRPPEVSAVLNIKKTKTVASSMGASQLLTTRTSVWWVCMIGAKLYFYQFYGDSAPRLISDVIDATAIQGRDKNGAKTGFVSLIHKDARMWPMLFPTAATADEFANSIAAMRKLVEETPKGSPTLRTYGIIEPDEFGFFCPIH